MIRHASLSLALLALAMVISACGTSGTSSPPAVSMTGEWEGTSTFQDGYVDEILFVLDQDGASVSGVFQVWDVTEYVTLGTLSGTVSGRTVRLNLDATLGDGGSGTLTGTASETRYTGSGSLRNSVTGEEGVFSFIVERR